METTTTSLRLGASIRERRISIGMTQGQLADTVGTSRPSMSALENGEIGQARILFRTAEAIGLDIFALPREDRRAKEIKFQQRTVAEGQPAQRVSRGTKP